MWLQVEGFDKVYAIANEDLDRSTDEKTSAVHFMRFEFTPAMTAALRKRFRMMSTGHLPVMNSLLFSHYRLYWL